VNKFPIRNFIPNNILSIVLLLFISCGDKREVNISQTIQFEGKIYLLDAEDPFSGILYHEYPNGQREYEGEYKNGKPNGYLIYWYDSDVKMREGKLKSGSPTGRWTYYNPDGSIKEIIDH